MLKNRVGVATITRTNCITSVAATRSLRSSNQNLRKYLRRTLVQSLCALQRLSCRICLWSTRTNIIESVSNFGNRRVPRKYMSSLNVSETGHPEVGYIPMNFLQSNPISRCWNDNWNAYLICSNVWNKTFFKNRVKF